VREIVRLRAAGVAEVGADLIAGLPYQTTESWQHSLSVATSVGLTHLSVYMLEVDEDSRLGLEVLAGGKRFHAHGVPAEEIAAELYERACEALPREGFAQYEISNFAAQAHRSRHNVKYWRRAPYLGLGLDAHSMLPTAEGAVRFANVDELPGYMGGGQDAGLSAPVQRRASGRDENVLVGVGRDESSVVRVGEREAFEETIFLNEGLCIAALREAFPRELVASCEEAARELIAEGLMMESDGQWRLTLRGRLVSNEVFGHLLEEQEVGNRK
jgi:oxygen-independent coproporphyrinogen-3 oxidase